MNQQQTPPPKDDSGVDLNVRLKEIQQTMKESEALRKKLRYVSLGGALAVLLLLGLFCYRLYAYATTYDTKKLRTQLLEESKPVIKAETDELIKTMQGEIVRNFVSKIKSNLKQEMPKINQEFIEMGGRLYDHSQEHVEKRLVDVLTKSFEDSEKEIQKAFPEFSTVDLHQRMEKVKPYFVEQLTHVIELRLAKVNASIDGLKSAVKRVQEAPGSEKYSKDQLSAVEDQLLDALLDLIVYEIKPELGREPAPMNGGAK